MMIPSAMNIESALPQLGIRGVGGRSEAIRDDQCKELISAVGADSAGNIGVTFPLTADFQIGYALGLETARAVIAGSMEVMLKKANPDNIL